jgi:hypothetical protein
MKLELDPIWVMTSPNQLVRFDGAPHRSYRPLGGFYLRGSFTSARLQAFDVQVLSFIDPLTTYLPTWTTERPPPDHKIDNAGIDFGKLAHALERSDSPAKGVFRNPRFVVEELLRVWEIRHVHGIGHECPPVSFLKRLQAANEGTDREWKVATAYGLMMVAPVVPTPADVLSAAMKISYDHARQIIFQLRQLRLLPPPPRKEPAWVK